MILACPDRSEVLRTLPEPPLSCDPFRSAWFVAQLASDGLPEHGIDELIELRELADHHQRRYALLGGVHVLEHAELRVVDTRAPGKSGRQLARFSDRDDGIIPIVGDDDQRRANVLQVADG